MFSKCFICILIATVCFEMWNIVEDAFNYFVKITKILMKAKK